VAVTVSDLLAVDATVMLPKSRDVGLAVSWLPVAGCPPDMTPVLPHPVPSTIRIEMTKRARLRATDRLFTGTPLGTQVAYYPICANRLWQGVRATNIDSNAKAKTLDLGDYSGRGAGDLVHGLRDIIQSSARSSQTELLTLS